MLVVPDYITMPLSLFEMVYCCLGGCVRNLEQPLARDAVSSLQMAMSHCLLFSSASCAVQ